MSMMTDMVDALQAAGIEAWLPGRHEGTCRGAYAVVADDGLRRMGKTTGRHVYIVTAYVPKETPTALNGMLAGIRTALAGLDGIRETGEQSPDDIDDELEAYYCSLEYSALCSLI